MRVYKNLFGNGSKINASEIVTKNAAGQVVGLDLLGVERGSNENGEWVRWNFGWQVCWIFVRNWPGAKPNTAQGSLYATAGNLIWTYPMPFHKEPVVDGTSSGNTWVVDSGVASRDGRESFMFRVVRYSTASADPIVRLRAAGWWKQPGT